MALSQPELDGTIGAGLDPCFARQLRFKLLPCQSAVVTFIFGEALSEQELHELVVRYSSGAALDAAFAEASLGWKESLGGLRVTSASPEIDRMINGWLPYQALSSRILGRTAFYQSSGAYGFRDQLQDAGNLCLLWPELTRRQILLHAGHQFEEGDVLHWWHGPPVERGVRTRFSDDLLWLPYVTYQYMQCTGDVQVLDAVAPFLKGPELDAAEQECYLKPCVSSEQGSVFEHCCRALDRSLTAGRHGLPLMGSGDWNDGMNRVGSDGRGESVWLGFFLYQILEWFIPLARQRGDALRADRYALYRKGVRQQLDIAGWDGNWYRRAYYDNGTPLGTRDAAECRIDGLVQAWAVLSDGAPANRAAQAMDAVERQLVNEADGLIRLLTPPFVNAPEDPGYIKGYVAGVRENGGQYTHAACWMVAAMAKLGRRDRALQLLIMLSPTWHTRNAEQVERYRVEPYVIAADIYGAEPHVGLGGWTWYTGSAGLAYRIAVESVLGLRLEGGRNLLLSPCVPDDWPDYYMEYRIPGSITRYIIDVRNPHGRTESVVGATIDGVALQPSRGIARVPVTDDGASHRVVITLG
jgi:cyclic beta-1,2-glucan synthetase